MRRAVSIWDLILHPPIRLLRSMLHYPLFLNVNGVSSSNVLESLGPRAISCLFASLWLFASCLIFLDYDPPAAIQGGSTTQDFIQLLPRTNSNFPLYRLVEKRSGCPSLASRLHRPLDSYMSVSKTCSESKCPVFHLSSSLDSHFPRWPGRVHIRLIAITTC